MDYKKLNKEAWDTITEYHSEEKEANRWYRQFKDENEPLLFSSTATK